MQFKNFLSILLLIILVITIKNIIKKNNLPARIDSIIQDYSENSRFSGRVLVSTDKGIIYQNTRETEPYLLADLSRLFTKTALIQLVRQKKICLTDYIGPFFNNHPALDSIRIGNLLDNSSGLPDLYHSNPLFLNPRVHAAPITLSALVTKILDELTTQPLAGTEVQFSSAAYVLLASIMEKSTGLPFYEIIKRQILVPLNMTATRPAINRNDSLLADMSYYTGTAGLISTVEDLYTLERGFRNPDFLDERDLFKLGSTSQFGSLPGYSSCFIRVPDLKIAIIILCDAPDMPLDIICDRILTVLLDNKKKYSEAIKTDLYTGTFSGNITDKMAVDFIVTAEKGTLFMTLPNPGRQTISVRLYPVTKNKFLTRLGSIFLNIIVTFKNNDTVIINIGGWQITAHKNIDG